MIREEQYKEWLVGFNPLSMNCITHNGKYIADIQDAFDIDDMDAAYKEGYIDGASRADETPIVNNDEYIALKWPEVQEYMESPRWGEVGYDPKKDLWFVPKDMIK